MEKSKQETSYQRSKRINKELNDIIKSNKSFDNVNLSDDARIFLLNNYAKSCYKSFTYKLGKCTKNPGDIITEPQLAVNAAKQYVKTNNIVNAQYIAIVPEERRVCGRRRDHYYSVKVNVQGRIATPDTVLLEKYKRDVNAKLRIKEQQKKYIKAAKLQRQQESIIKLSETDKLSAEVARLKQQIDRMERKVK